MFILLIYFLRALSISSEEFVEVFYSLRAFQTQASEDGKHIIRSILCGWELALFPHEVLVQALALPNNNHQNI